jgi:hypothetical protein
MSPFSLGNSNIDAEGNHETRLICYDHKCEKYLVRSSAQVDSPLLTEKIASRISRKTVLGTRTKAQKSLINRCFLSTSIDRKAIRAESTDIEKSQKV